MQRLASHSGTPLEEGSAPVGCSQLSGFLVQANKLQLEFVLYVGDESVVPSAQPHLLLCDVEVAVVYSCQWPRE